MKTENLQILNSKISNKLTLIVIVILCFFSSCKIQSQSNSLQTVDLPSTQESNVDYTLEFKTEIKGKILKTDKLQNAYLVTQNDELIKYDKTGKKLYTYSNFDLGEITHLDATNPFNILLYYGNFQTIVVLDRTLDPMNTFDLFQTNIPTINAIAMADDQNVWIYDEANFRLKKINQKGEIIFESNDLSLELRSTFSPTFLLESAGEVFLSEVNGTVYIFDVFARLLIKEDYKIPNAQIQTLDNKYLFLKKNEIYIINPILGNNSKNVLMLPEKKTKAIQAEIQQKRLFLLLEDKFEIYTFEKNKE